MVKLKHLSFDEALQVLKTVDIADLREFDREELHDALSKFPPSYERLSLYLGLVCGFHSLDTRTVFITDGNDNPIFFGTSTPFNLGEPKYKILCGFGWARACSILPGREKLSILEMVVDFLILGDTEATEGFVCYVKETNLETIHGWQFIKRRYNKLLDIKFCIDQFNTGYHAVKITRKSEGQ